MLRANQNSQPVGGLGRVQTGKRTRTRTHIPSFDHKQILFVDFIPVHYLFAPLWHRTYNERTAPSVWGRERERWRRVVEKIWRFKLDPSPTSETQSHGGSLLNIYLKSNQTVESAACPTRFVVSITVSHLWSKTSELTS